MTNEVDGMKREDYSKDWEMLMLLWFFLFFFLLTVYVSPVFYGPLWTDFSINGWMDG